MLIKYFILLTACLNLLGCADQSLENFKERAKAEQEGSNKAENENLEKKARAMEADLTRRHTFYSALEGEYEGALNIGQDSYKIKFTFARSIPPYTDNRTRQLSEIENDLNNLFFYMQIVQWHPNDQSAAVGCRVSGIRPNMTDGTLTVASTDCPNLYSILLSDKENANLTDKLTNAKTVAKKVKDLDLKDVPYLVGTIQPSTVAEKYSFTVRKLK